MTSPRCNHVESPCFGPVIWLSYNYTIELSTANTPDTNVHRASSSLTLFVTTRQDHTTKSTKSSKLLSSFTFLSSNRFRLVPYLHLWVAFFDSSVWSDWVVDLTSQNCSEITSLAPKMFRNTLIYHSMNQGASTLQISYVFSWQNVNVSSFENALLGFQQISLKILKSDEFHKRYTCCLSLFYTPRIVKPSKTSEIPFVSNQTLQVFISQKPTHTAEYNQKILWHHRLYFWSIYQDSIEIGLDTKIQK